ncbi:MAG: DUF4163 domain-containing protein [Clostridia bacterium]|nr:DUF4163 domain-containing protein [Clostridia bacterium]
MKIIKVVLITIAFMCFMPSAFADVTVFIDGTEVVFDEQPPVIINDRAFVPMRKIFEELGAYVDWIAETSTVYASKRFQNVTLTVGVEEYYVNEDMYILDAPAVIMNSRALVPVRVVAESLGADVLWDGANQRVMITNNHGDYLIEDRYIDYWECADDGTAILTGRVAYPEIISDDVVSNAFNEFFLGDAEETVDNRIIEYLESAKSSYSYALKNNTEYFPYMTERSFDITYNKDNIISIVFADSNFAGGFHPSYEMSAVTYNMLTGERIDCTDIIDADSNDIRKTVLSKFSELIYSDPDKFFSDAEDCLDDALSELKWYLADDGVHFFLNPYEIAPYSTGVIEIIY